MKRLWLVALASALYAPIALGPSPASADGNCVVNQSPYNPTGLLFFEPLCTSAGALQVAIVSGGGTGGGASGTPGSSGTTAQYVQGVPGGYPVAVTGSFSATTVFPYSAAQSQTSSTASFLGAAGVYYTSPPTLSNGQVNPLFIDGSGYLDIDVKTGTVSISNFPTTQTVAGTVAVSNFPSNQNVTITGPGTSAGNPLYVSGGGGGGGSSTYPYGVASAAPTANSFVGISGYDGTNVRPVSIDPTTGYLLTKSGASANGTYGAPNTTVTASATSVQYEQGTGPNGTSNVNIISGAPTPLAIQPVSGSVTATVNTAAPYVAPTCAAAPNAPCVQVTGSVNVNLGATPQPVSGTVTVANTPAPYATNASQQLVVGQSGAFNVNLGTTPEPVAITTGAGLSSPNPLYVYSVNGGGGGGGSTPIPFATNGAGQLVVAQATTVPVSVATTLPVSLATLPPLAAGTATIGSIANTAFGVTGTVTTTTTYPYSLATGGQTGTAGSGIGVLGQYNSTALTLTNGQVAPLQLDSSGNLDVNVKVGGGSSSYPFSTVPFPTATQTPAANTAVGISCPVATPTSAPTGGVIPITCSATNGGINLAPATLGAPYSLVTQGQTAQAGSGLGVLGVYNSTAPTLTTGQAAPLQLNASGAVITSQSNAIQPYNATSGQAQQTASFVGIAGYASGSVVNAAYVDSAGVLRTTTCAAGSSNCASVTGSALQTVAAAVTGLGATRYAATGVGNTTPQALCASACTAYAISAYNNGTSPCFLTEYNTASGSVTVGTTVGVRLLYLPATSEAADNLPPTIGEAFSTAWSYTLTTAPGGSTACSGTVYVQADYK